MNALRNKVLLIGNLGNDPEIKIMESGNKLARFSMATNETFRNQQGEKTTETQWHNIIAWGKTAELMEQWLQKGKQVMIDGKLHHRTYDDKDGARRYVTEIVVNEFLVLTPKGDDLPY